MPLIHIVVGLALAQFVFFCFAVGKARGTYKVSAPATTGNEMFERYFRVHQNTLEQLVVFVPAIFIFATYVHMLAAAALGFLFVVARAIYAMGYVKDPEKRAGGAAATFVVNLILVLGGLIGVVVYVTFSIFKIPVVSMLVGLCALGAAAMLATLIEVLSPSSESR